MIVHLSNHSLAFLLRQNSTGLRISSTFGWIAVCLFAVSRDLPSRINIILYGLGVMAFLAARQHSREE